MLQIERRALLTIVHVLLIVLVVPWKHSVAQSPDQTIQTSRYDWDLESQYPDEASWTASLREVQQRLAAFEPMRSQPITSAAQLADRLDEIRFLRGRAGHMARFAILHNQVDDTSQEAKARLDAATELETKVEAGVSWINRAVLSNGDQTVKSWIAHEPRLQMHSYRLNNILSLGGHFPAAGSESAIASLERASQTPTSVYDALMQSDLGWPTITGADGKEHPVNADTFASLRRDKAHDVRETASRAFFGRIKSMEEPLGLLLTRRLTVETDLAHARHYSNAIDAFFNWGDGLPVGSYRKLIEGAHANRATLDRYVRLVARLNNLQQMGFSDLSVPAQVFEQKATLAQAIENIAVSWAAMGEDYQSTLRERLMKPWMDWRPRPHKSGVGVYWGVDGSNPYTVLTFDGSLAATKTLAEAAASVMFLSNIPRAKSRERREEDFPVYGNAIWFLGQMLYDDYVLKQTTDKNERIAILYDNCRRLWEHYFQYAIYLDLEQRIYSSIDENHPLSGAQISQTYMNRLHDYYSNTSDLLKIDDSFSEIALVDGNSYYGEVLAEWAFAMASASAIAERLKANDATTISALKHPMSRPNSFTSNDLLIDAGVDVNSMQPYEALVRRMNHCMDAIEAELAK